MVLILLLVNPLKHLILNVSILIKHSIDTKFNHVVFYFFI